MDISQHLLHETRLIYGDLCVDSDGNILEAYGFRNKYIALFFLKKNYVCQPDPYEVIDVEGKIYNFVTGDEDGTRVIRRSGFSISKRYGNNLILNLPFFTNDDYLILGALSQHGKTLTDCSRAATSNHQIALLLTKIQLNYWHHRERYAGLAAVMGLFLKEACAAVDATVGDLPVHDPAKYYCRNLDSAFRQTAKQDQIAGSKYSYQSLLDTKITDLSTEQLNSFGSELLEIAEAYGSWAIAKLVKQIMEKHGIKIP